MAGPNRRKYGYWPDRTDRNMGFRQTEQIKIWVLARPNRPKFGYWPDRTGQNLGIGQTEQTEIWALARPNRPKYGYWPDRTDRNMGIRRTEQTKIAIGQTEGATQIFFQTIVDGCTGPPCPRPKSVWPIPVFGLRTSSWDGQFDAQLTVFDVFERSLISTLWDKLYLKGNDCSFYDPPLLRGAFVTTMYYAEHDNRNTANFLTLIFINVFFVDFKLIGSTQAISSKMISY